MRKSQRRGPKAPATSMSALGTMRMKENSQKTTGAEAPLNLHLELRPPPRATNFLPKLPRSEASLLHMIQNEVQENPRLRGDGNGWLLAVLRRFGEGSVCIAELEQHGTLAPSTKGDGTTLIAHPI